MPQSSSFRIRLVGGVSLLFVDGMSFDILDVTNHLLCVYDYRGLSFSISTPVSASFRGPWNDFRTLQPMRVDDFGGMAHIASVGVMDSSVNLLTISPLGSPPVNIEPFNTGLSVGFSAGGGMGSFSRMFPAIEASRAPWPHTV
jgi:hypothetical protein